MIIAPKRGDKEWKIHSMFLDAHVRASLVRRQLPGRKRRAQKKKTVKFSFIGSHPVYMVWLDETGYAQWRNLVISENFLCNQLTLDYVNDAQQS